MDKYYDEILEKIPESIDFNFIPVQTKSSLYFTLENKSSMSILFNIDSSNGYVFTPASGVIMKNKKLEIQVSVTPEAAVVIVANAKISLDDKKSKIIKLSSIAKYPYLTINRSHLDFGIIQVGKYSVQDLIITNPESVQAKFEIKKHSVQPGKHPEVFFISNTTGTIPPNSAFLLKVKYKTFFPGIASYETYTIQTIGGNSFRFSCAGSAQSLATWINAKRVNFKSIPLGNQTTRLIRIYNDSDKETDYQIFHNNDGAFKIKSLQGVIKPHSNARVNITFRPYETMKYYERVFCLIKNHSLVPIDIYGSCHDLLTKTPLIEQKFIDMFRYKLLNGLYFDKTQPPLEVRENIERYTKTLATKGTTDLENSLVDSTSQLQLHKEMFWETNSATRILSFDNESIDFRFVDVGQTSEPYILRVKNNSNERVKVKWILEKPINTSNLIKIINLFNYEDCVFIIQPEESIINKQGVGEFKVYFKPNKTESYFYSDIPCQVTLMPANEILTKEANDQTKLHLMPNKKSLKPIANKTMSSFGYKTKMGFSSKASSQGKGGEYFDPPITSTLSVVGHSFPPGTQVFIPIYELDPKRDLYFPPSTLNQSMYQTLKITNKSDTPLFYQISEDPAGIFRVHRKCGLIPAQGFHLICVEFCPKDNTVYKCPLRIVLNHDVSSVKTVILNGLSVDPVIEIEGVKKELYFPPSFVGIKTKKKLTVINRSPVKVQVNIKVEDAEEGIVEVNPSSFEMGTNLIKEIEVSFCPNRVKEISSKIIFIVERLYNTSNECVGIYNPGSLLPKRIKEEKEKVDKRQFVREITVLGRGSDGSLTLTPSQLDFGTVKVGFHKKLVFSISNPTITNFYVKLEIETINDERNQKDSVKFDFTEGLINSFCKKDITVTFLPETRSAVYLKVKVYATENSQETEVIDTQKQGDLSKVREKKCELLIKANGDYPLIKIADIRNDSVGTCALWHSFNVDEANQELQKQLTDEEINYMSNEKEDKKIQEFTDKLKLIKFDFGKHIKKKNAKNNFFDVYLTLKNEGGVTSEFYFKFPDDISIKREIWMDPVEPTSNDKVEYHVLKEKIFEIEPRKSKLEPNECCNIRLRYNKKEKGDHRLRVIFQIVNGKPLIFELFAQCYSEKQGILEIKRPVLDFSYVPIGYMDYIVSPIELSNVGGVKIKYKIFKELIDEFNEQNSHFKIFKMDSLEGTIGPGDLKYLPVYFRPLTNKLYELNLTVHFTDEITGESSIPIMIRGMGYHPQKFQPPPEISPFHTMPQDRMSNEFKGEFIQKCGVSVEEIDFGSVTDQTKNVAFILYNFSENNSFSFDFREPGFLLDDEIEIKPNKDKLEANSHTIIKMALTPKGCVSNYEGEIEINITWNAENANKVLDKEKLHLRIRKKSQLKETSGFIEESHNENQCFVERILTDLTKEILSSEEFQNTISQEIDNQPLGIYDWTTDIPYPSQGEVRRKINGGYGTKANSLINSEINNSNSFNVKRTTQHKNSTISKEKEQVAELDLYGEKEDYRIQDKYMSELLTKYKLTVPEVNESLAVVNEESRKLISNDIMEATVYNIISEAVYGETDLTEKTRIYFFNK